MGATEINRENSVEIIVAFYTNDIYTKIQKRQRLPCTATSLQLVRQFHTLPYRRLRIQLGRLLCATDDMCGLTDPAQLPV